MLAAGLQQQQQQPKQGQQQRVPADVVLQLGQLMPDFLHECCAAAAAALPEGCPGSSGSRSSSGSSSIPDADALLLALSGILSCLQLFSECIQTASLSTQHAAAAAVLRSTCPAPLLPAVPVLLAAALAAGGAAAACERRASSTQALEQHKWAALAEAAAHALLQLLPMLPLPVTAAPAAAAAAVVGAASTSAAGAAIAAAEAAAAADAGPSCLLELLPELLAASSALQRSRYADPPRRACLALLCRCLGAVASTGGSSGNGSGAAHAAPAVQACRSLLRLLLSPAVAYEIQPEFLWAENDRGRQLAQVSFQAASEALPAAAAATASRLAGATAGGGDGAELARLAGDTAYLAINALAGQLAHSWRPSGRLLQQPGANKSTASEVRRLLARHADWQLSALQSVDWWLRHAAESPTAPNAAPPAAAAAAPAGAGAAVKMEGAAAAVGLSNGPPPALFIASTLAGMLTMALDPGVLAQALAVLQQLAAADPLLLLSCDSLPLLVHAAARKAYHEHASSYAHGAADSSSTSSREAAGAKLQHGMELLLQQAQQAAASAGSSAAALWPLWQQHPPACLAAATGSLPPPAVVAGAPGSNSSSATPAWDRLAAAAATMTPADPRLRPPGAAGRMLAAGAAGVGGRAAGGGGMHEPQYGLSDGLGGHYHHAQYEAQQLFNQLVHSGEMMGMHPEDILYEAGILGADEEGADSDEYGDMYYSDDYEYRY